MLSIRIAIVALLLLLPQQILADIVFSKDFKEETVEAFPYYSQDQRESFDVPGFFDPAFPGWKEGGPLFIDSGVALRYAFRFTIQSDSETDAVISYPWNTVISMARLYRQRPDAPMEQWGPDPGSVPRWNARLHKGANQFLIILDVAGRASFKRTMKVYSPHHYMLVEGSKYAQLSFIYGMASALTFFCLCLYGFYRKSYLLWYIAYSCSALFILMVGSLHLGMSNVHFWNIAIIICSISSAGLTMQALELRTATPILAKILLGFCAVATLCFLGHTMILIAKEIFYLSGIAVCAFCALIAMVRMVDGYKPAIYFALGWSLLVAGMVTGFVTAYFQIFVDATGSLSTMALYYGFALETMLFTLAVAFRTHDSESQAVDEKMHAFSQLEKIVYAHQIKEIRTGKEIEKTMPTHTAEAVIITFTMIDTSNLLQHEFGRDFLRSLFRRCNEVMMEGYDGSHLKATAYRLQQSAEGFVCAVGYPFQSPTNDLAYDACVLAHRFYEVLQRHVELLGARFPIRCSMGMAMGPITGLYPEWGTKEYDVEGRPIFLATRYESMRPVLFKHMPITSLLVLQEKVYKALSRNQGDFTEFDLLEHGVTVRDDPMAPRLYFLDFERYGKEKKSKAG